MQMRRYVLMWLSALIGLAAMPPAHAQVSVPLPPLMHFCDDVCGTLALQGDHYVNITKYSWTPANFTSVWKVVQFTPQQVVLYRHDSPDRANPLSGPNGWDVVFSGQPNSDRLAEIQINGMPKPGICITWGAALTLIPGSNEERDRRGQPACSQVATSPTYAQATDAGGAVAMATAYVDQLETADLGWVYDNDMSPNFHATFFRPAFIGLIKMAKSVAGGGHLTRDMVDAHPLPENTLHQPCACYFVRFRTTFPHGAVFQDIYLEPIAGTWKVMASFSAPTL